MPNTVLMLGHAKTSGLLLARALIGIGFQPEVAGWREFDPKSYRRRKPAVILANADHKQAWPTARLCSRVRRLWGESYPIVVVTESQRFLHVATILDAGADACLPPDTPAAALERKLRRCIRRGAAVSSPGLADDTPEDLVGIFRDNPNLVRLGDLASVYAGVAPRTAWSRRIAPPGDGWRGVVTSDIVDRFSLGRPANYLLWSRLHLFRIPGPGEYDVPEKVFLSRCGPPLAAAVDKSGLPAGADVYSIVPGAGVGAGFLACLLNSRLLDFYFNRLADNPGGRLRIESIRETPIPRPTPAANQAFSRHATLLAHFGPNPESWVDRQSRADIREEMDAAVFSLYGVETASREELAALHF